jgi:hypothetical protein
VHSVGLAVSDREGVRGSLGNTAVEDNVALADSEALSLAEADTLPLAVPVSVPLVVSVTLPLIDCDCDTVLVAVTDGVGVKDGVCEGVGGVT